MTSHLRDQLKQNKPFGSLEEEVHLNLVRTTARLGEPLHALLKSHELTPAQYNVLRILRGAGGDGLSCGETGERLVTREPDVTRLVDRMEKRGLLQRRGSTTDRRVVKLCLTPHGLSLVNALDEPVQRAHAEVLGHLTREELERLNELLESARNED